MWRLEEWHCRTATGKFSTNFRAEAEALKTVGNHLTRNLGKTYRNIVIFTEAFSVLLALLNSKKKKRERFFMAFMTFMT